MDAFLDEVDMWATTPRGVYDIGFYDRLKRSNEIRSKIALVQECQKEFYIRQARLENNWTSSNFDGFGDASWNLKFSKSELDELVKDTMEQINAWRTCF
jgi:hypothetical protein